MARGIACRPSFLLVARVAWIERLAKCFPEYLLVQLVKVRPRLLVHPVNAPIEVLALVLAVLAELALEVVHLLLGVLHLFLVAGLLALFPAKLGIEVGAH